jgi:hypothetical protein
VNFDLAFSLTPIGSSAIVTDEVAGLLFDILEDRVAGSQG